MHRRGQGSDFEALELTVHLGANMDRRCATLVHHRTVAIGHKPVGLIHYLGRRQLKIHRPPSAQFPFEIGKCGPND